MDNKKTFEKGNYMIDIKKNADTVERMVLVGSEIEVTELPEEGLTINFGELKIDREESNKKQEAGGEDDVK